LGTLDVWKRSKHWECIFCIENQARDAVNDLEVNPVSSRGHDCGVRSGLRVLQWNVDGIGTAIADVITLVREDPGLDVLLLQETKIICGLLTYDKADIPFCQIPAYCEEEVVGGLAPLAVEIQNGARGKFVITNLYMPPSGSEVRVVSTQGD
jgi:hypothetical protein